MLKKPSSIIRVLLATALAGITSFAALHHSAHALSEDHHGSSSTESCSICSLAQTKIGVTTAVSVPAPEVRISYTVCVGHYSAPAAALVFASASQARAPPVK